MSFRQTPMNAPHFWIYPPDSPLHFPLILSIPHSGEKIPIEATWLHSTPESILLTDVDRFVNELYTPAIEKLKLPALQTTIHRYAVDLNRIPDDIDRSSVEGAPLSAGTHPKGFHWAITTQGDVIINQPIAASTHEMLVRLYHNTFHKEFIRGRSKIRAHFPSLNLYHFDCHSMPSHGTSAHTDAGKRRADIVISDCLGKSSSQEFLNLTVSSFEKEGLSVSVNSPYTGGRITQRYGKPEQGEKTIQIEINRALYMNEQTKEKNPDFKNFTDLLTRALTQITLQLPENI